MMINEMYLGVHVRTWLTAALVLVVTAVGHFVLRAWRRRRAAHIAEAPPAAAEPWSLRHWIDRLLAASLGQLAMLLWIYGPYAAISLLLADASASGAHLATAAQALRWVRDLITIAALCWLLARIGRVVEAHLVELAARSDNRWDDIALPVAGKAVRLALPLVAIILYAPVLQVSPNLQTLFSRVVSILLIGTIAAILLQLVNQLAALILARYRIDVADNLRGRAVQTQVMVLKKVAVAVIVVFTGASMLMVFDSVRHFGTSILASAGVAGIILGFAAQRSLATLLAGFQIAVTQPIRIDDVVIVEGEWGRVEEITLTYIVVKIWDLRRLVLPVTYFIEKPFQNWTRTSSNRLGSVFIWVDYTFPVEEGRKALKDIIEGNPLWDGDFWNLQVSDTTDRTIQLRVLATAKDSSTEWNLRCDIRERFIAFIREQHPTSLPRVRGELREVRMGEAPA